MTLGRAPDTGATAVETAIVLPIILTLVFGMIDFGLWAFNSAQATQSAREASRVAMIRPPTPGSVTLDEDEDEVDAADRDVYEAANRGVVFGPANVSSACTPDCQYGSRVTITSEWQFTFLTPVGPLITGDTSGQVTGTSTRHIVGVS